MATAHRREGKLADITGPGITDRWGVTCTDLGASVIAPDGSLVWVFGDTVAGDSVGQGDWRSPVILIGTGDAHHPISYHRAGGADLATRNNFGITRTAQRCPAGRAAASAR